MLYNAPEKDSNPVWEKIVTCMFWPTLGGDFTFLTAWLKHNPSGLLLLIERLLPGKRGFRLSIKLPFFLLSIFVIFFLFSPIRYYMMSYMAIKIHSTNSTFAQQRQKKTKSSHSLPFQEYRDPGVVIQSTYALLCFCVDDFFMMKESCASLSCFQELVAQHQSHII